MTLHIPVFERLRANSLAGKSVFRPMSPSRDAQAFPRGCRSFTIERDVGLARKS